jgi:hypothetical protein
MLEFKVPELTLSMLNLATVFETVIGVWLTPPIWRSVVESSPEKSIPEAVKTHSRDASSN